MAGCVLHAEIFLNKFSHCSLNVFNCFLTFEILLFKFQYIARCYDEALIISTLHRYRNSGNFHVKIIHVINIHFDLIFVGQGYLRKYFYTNIYYQCSLILCSSVNIQSLRFNTL